MSSADLERTLRDLLVIEGTSERVALNLIKRMTTTPPTRKERLAFVHFLIHAGFYRETLALFIDWFKEKKRLPLMAFCHLLQRSGFRPKAEFIAQLFLAVDEVEEPLFHFSAWETIDPRFAALREKVFHDVMINAAEHKQKLIAKLDYFQQNRMIEEEQRLIDELVAVYPHDTDLKLRKEGFKMRWADALIARKALESFDDSFDLTKAKMSPADAEAARIISTAFTEAASRFPQSAYDLAIGLYFLDFYESAKTILEIAPPGFNVDWFYAECLLQSRRFLECLDFLQQIELKYSADPETTFGVTYYRAQALNGLGQLGVATQLLKSIVSIRPGYRAAHSLLLKWAGQGMR